jgi:hypothetical protein
MDAMRSALTAAGLDTGHIHTELFGALPPINPGVVGAPPPTQPHAPEDMPGSGPRITFARSGLSVNWSSRFHTLLEFAEACDVPTRYSCRSGVCRWTSPPTAPYCCARPNRTAISSLISKGRSPALA